MLTFEQINADPQQYLGQNISIEGDVNYYLTPTPVKTISSVSASLIPTSIAISDLNNQQAALHIYINDIPKTIPRPDHNDPYIGRQLDAMFTTLPELHAFYREIDADSESVAKQQFHIHLGKISISGTLAQLADDPAIFTLIDLENAVYSKNGRSVHLRRGGMFSQFITSPDVNFVEVYRIFRNQERYLGNRIAVRGRLTELEELVLSPTDIEFTLKVARNVGTRFGGSQDSKYEKQLSKSIQVVSSTLKNEIETYIPTLSHQLLNDYTVSMIGTLVSPDREPFFATLQNVELALIEHGNKVYQWDFSDR